MSLPFSGTCSLNDIKIEQNQPTKSPYSLIDASTSAAGYSLVNPDSFWRPKTPPYSISDWRGYSATTIVWSNLFSNTKLEIFVNNTKVIDTSVATGITISVNKNDTFYATFTPICYCTFTSLNLNISQRNTTSPFPYVVLQSISRAAGNFSPNSTSATPITVTPNALGIGAYRINTFGLPAPLPA
jgi:hypothetical protein